MNSGHPQAKIDLQLARIGAEVRRAIALHPGNESLHHAYAVMLEELDEFWEEVKRNPGKLSPEARHEWRHKMQTELIQLAATAIRATIDCGLM